MKQIIARILNTANQLDESGLYAEANILTRIAQEIPFDPTAPNSANQYDSNIHQLGNDIGSMFGTSPTQNYQAKNMMNQMEDSMNDKIITFLTTVAAMNVHNDNGMDSVLIDIDLAHHIQSEAKRLLAEMKEYTGKDMEDDGEGPTDEQLFGQAEDYSLHQGRMDQQLQDAGRTPYPY